MKHVVVAMFIVMLASLPVMASEPVRSNWPGVTGGSGLLANWLSSLKELPKADDSVPLSEIKRVALLKAKSVWGSRVTLGPCIPYMGVDNRVLAYHCCIARDGHAFPELGAGLDERLNDPNWYRNFGHVLVSARRSFYPVPAFGEGLPRILTGAADVEAAAVRALSAGRAKLVGMTILGTVLDVVCEFEAEGDTAFVQPYGTRAVSKEDFSAWRSELSPYLVHVDSASLVKNESRWQDFERRGAPRFDAHRIPNYQSIEEYYWSYGCSPTSAAMVLSYYDSTNSEYGNLISEYYSHVDPVTSSDEYHTPRAQQLLAGFMNTDTIDPNPPNPQGGGTSPLNVSPGIVSYCQSLGYTVSSDVVISFFEDPAAYLALCLEIGSEKSCIWSMRYVDIQGVEGHSTAAYGYDDLGYVILHNTFDQGEQEWYHLLYDNEYPNLATYTNTVHPVSGGGANLNLKLLNPDGGDGWGYLNGSGPTYYGGQTYTVLWDNGGNSSGHVDIFSSTTGGRTWSQITSNSPNNGQAQWVAPEITSDSGRIRLDLYDSRDTRVAQDGSWGDFYIRPNPFPPAPTPLSPPDGSDVGTLTPTLQVQAIPGATFYEFEVYDGGNRVAHGITASNSWPTPALTNGTTYTWRCRAQNPSGDGPYSSAWSFTVSISGPPVPPTPLAPPNGSTVSTLRPTLQVQDVPGAIIYRYLVTRRGVYVRDGTVGTSSWQLDTNLQNGYVYDWVCRCSTAGGRSDWSTSWSFTVDVGGPPPSPEDWPMYHKDTTHSGYSAERISPPYDTAWTYQVAPSNWSSMGSPIVMGGYVYFGSDYSSGSEGYLNQIDTLAGHSVHLYDIGGNIGTSTPCYSGGRVFFNARSASTTRGTFCLDASDLSLIWHEPFPPGTYDLGSGAPVTVSGGSLFTHYEYTNSVEPEDSFFFRNANSGARLSAYAKPRWSLFWGTCVVYGGYVYVLACASNSNDWGLFKFSTGGAYQTMCSLTYPNSLCTPALSGGKLYLSDANRLVCLDPSAMSITWSQPVTGISGSPAVGSASGYEVVYAGSAGGNLYAFDAASGTPLSGWPKTLSSSAVNPPSIADTIVYCGTDDGHFFAVGGRSGTTILDYNCGAQIKDCPAISHGKIYVATHQARVFAFRHVAGNVTDVGVTAIVRPSGITDSGSVIAPLARVQNFGSQSQTFNATFRVGSWTQTRSKTLLGGAIDTVSFPNWTAGHRGYVVTKCTVALTGDELSENNSLTDSVFVRVGDVGVSRLIAPTGAVDSGAVVTPACSLYNHGTAAESYNVRMKINTDYDEIVTVNNAPGAMFTAFPNWTAAQTGAFAVMCSTELTGDMNHANDRQSGTVTVRFKDVGCVRILTPYGAIDSGTVVTPACSVYNYGTTTETYPVRMKIGASYNQATSVSAHAPGTWRYVTFPNWTAIPRWTVAFSCSTELAGDAQTYNDRRTGSVHVRVQDVGALQILSPTGQVDSGTVVTPKAVVGDFGTIPEVFTAVLRIGADYLSAVSETLIPGLIDTLQFQDWIASPVGVHIVVCSTGLAGDVVPGNNVTQDSVEVLPWTSIADEEARPELPHCFALCGCEPNPIRDFAQIAYDIAVPCRSRIDVFDARGRIVCVLLDASQTPGRHRVTWDRRDSRGLITPAGLYFCRMEAGGFLAVRKMLLVE
jgi:hypothetical protein